MLKVRIYAKWHLRRRRAASRLPSSHSVPLCIQFFLGVLRLLISSHLELENKLKRIRPRKSHYDTLFLSFFIA